MRPESVGNFMQVIPRRYFVRHCQACGLCTRWRHGSGIGASWGRLGPLAADVFLARLDQHAQRVHRGEQVAMAADLVERAIGRFTRVGGVDDMAGRRSSRSASRASEWWPWRLAHSATRDKQASWTFADHRTMKTKSSVSYRKSRETSLKDKSGTGEQTIPISSDAPNCSRTGFRRLFSMTACACPREVSLISP